MAQYTAQLNSFDAKIEQTQTTIKKFQADEDAYKQRVGHRQASRGHADGSRRAWHRVAAQQVDVAGPAHRYVAQRSDYDHNSLVEAQHTLASLQADREAFVQQWFSALSQELVTARSALDSAKAQLEKATKHQDLVRLTATENSVVLTLAKLSVGSVLKEGDALFTLMPIGYAARSGNAHRLARRGFRARGDRCVLKIDAFNFIEHGTAEGKVSWISEGAFTTDDNGQPDGALLQGPLRGDGDQFHNVPENFRLIPGMTLQADMNVGTRSVAAYLLGGVVKGFSKSMREP